MTDRFKTLGARIRAARLANGLTHDEVALACGVTRNSVSLWESGDIKNPRQDKLIKYAKLTNVTLGWLINREGGDPDWPEAKPRQKVKRIRPTETAGQSIPEMELHDDALREGSRVGWSLPSDILQLSFNCAPESVVIVRATFDMGPIAAGDFLLLDQSRAGIERAGIYFVVLGAEVKHVRVERTDGGAVVYSGEGKRLNSSGIKALGRVAAILRSA